ncbi:MAG: hypothetical protein KY475_01070 [Planctomycetes bacterium]|nr:hypothetical protein [Planctomycetota bacterium]
MIRMLGLLGAVEDADVTGAWRVFRFGDLENKFSAGGQPATLDIADFVSGQSFLKHKPRPEVSVTAPDSLTTLAEVIALVEPPVAKLAIADDGPATFSITFKLKSIDLRKIRLRNGVLGDDEPIDLTGKKIVLSIETNGDFEINGVPVNDSTAPAGNTISDVVPMVEGSDSEQSIGFEIEIAGGRYEHPLPVVAGVKGSKVILDWDKFRLRLRDDQLGLAAPPGAEDDEVMRATLHIPLIQAEVGAEAANALAKLIPAEASGNTILVPLEFTVTIKRPNDTLNVEPLLLAVKRTSGALEDVGQLITAALSELRAVFKEDRTSSNKLNGFFTPLAELGESVSSGLEFVVEKVQDALAGSAGLTTLFKSLDAFNTTAYPVPLALRVGKNGGSQVIFLLVVRLNLWTGRLAENRSYFYIVEAATNPNDLLDFKSFAIELPMRESGKIQKLPSADDHDGYLDFDLLDLVLDYKQPSPPDRPRTTVFVPGDLEGGNQDRDQRVRLVLRDFDPAIWPEEPDKGETLQLRLSASGLTFASAADTVTPAKIPAGGGTFPLRLDERRDGLRSALVVIDNQMRYASLVGRIEVPGFENLEADLEIGLRKEKPQAPPVVVATIDFDRTDRKPLAKLNIPFLKAQLDDLKMQLSWVTGSNPQWDFKAWATGSISVTGELQSTGGIKGLDQPTAIPFRDLNLLELHKGDGRLPLMPTKRQDGAPSTADDPARFELLDGQFKIEFYRGDLRWDLQRKEIGFDVDRARFDYQASSGDLDVAIEAGKIGLLFDVDDRSVDFKMPSSLGLEVRIGTQIAFEGEVGWENNERELYFRADGRLTMSGFPEVAGALKLGTGIKDDGSTAPNLAVFAELPYEADLFSGVVLKRMGLGLGLNNRLAAIGDRPDPRSIVARIDEIDPKNSRNWSFVSDSGVYVSVVATAMIASNRGEDDVACAYLAKLLLSIDTNIDVVAAAQIWLFSSPQFLTKADHERRPAFVGAAVLRAREQTFSLFAQTLPRPAIEANKMLSDLLSRVQARFSFYLSANLADYYLEELSYREQMFGISVQAVGSYRIAIGRFGALMRASLGFRGTIPQKRLAAGPGGFTFSGGLQLDAEFGGLVSQRGLAAYGAVRAGITFRVSAFIIVPTIALKTVSYEETISISFSVPYLKCKRWSCKWKRRRVSKSITIRVTLVIPVVKMEPYHMPEASLELVLEGALAFDESGGVGFRGTVGISTSIFGHKLRIAPRFDYRPEVIRSVQRRIAAIENHINQLRGLPRPALQQDAGLEEPPEVETWYYYTSRVGNEMLHLLVPSPEYPTWWYTPRATSMSHYANLPRDTGGSYLLQFMMVATTSELVADGTSTVVVAMVGGVLHIRIFDESGEVVIDKPKAELRQGNELDAFIQQLTPFPADTSGLPYETQVNVIRQAAALASHTLLEGVASDLEKQHLSPFRGAVMRMVMPFVNQNDALQRVKHVVDLSMPWDRANFDALPGEGAISDNDLIDLVTRMTEIESAFLNTAASASDPTAEETEWLQQEFDPNRVPLTGVEVVSDPRPESGARSYWLLSDQMNRPDGVLPYRYRPVEELVSEGFSGVDRRDDIARLLRYEQVRLTAAAQGRYEDVDPAPARQAAEARAGLLSTILRDFVRERGPETYGQITSLNGEGSPLSQLRLVRRDDGPDRPVVTRRRAAQWVVPDGGTETAQLTYAILENNTDLDLEPDGDDAVNLTVTLPDGSTADINLREKLKELYDPIDPLGDVATQETARIEARYVPIIDGIPLGEAKSVVVTVSRDQNSNDSPGAPLTDRVVFESVTNYFDAVPPEIVRQVGLFAVTSFDDQNTANNLRLDLDKVRIVRNEPDSSVTEWSHDMPIRIVPMTDPNKDPVEAIQRWVACLPPCQEYLGGEEVASGEKATSSADPRVRVKLPVKFEDELLKAQLPRLNGFEIYRRFPWQQQPVKIADGVPPILRRVDERGRTVMLVEKFLFGEDFPYNPDTGQFEGVSQGVIPGVTRIEYSLRAIPFGHLPTTAEPTFLHWSAVTLHVPPPKRELPALGLVIPAENLLPPETGDQQIPLHFVDNRPQTWLWPEGGWDAIEIWVEPYRIRSSGAYALGDAGAQVDPRTAQQESIRHPRDLTAERLPESTSGKIKVAVLRKPAGGGVPSGSLRVTDDGRVVGGFPSLRRGQAYRLFVRPEVPTEQPLVQPLSLYLIRELPQFIDEATPLLHLAEQKLEFVSQTEVDRILSPLSISIRDQAWLPAEAITISSRTTDNDPRERLRIAWDHKSDLDAGVEVLAQDCDEPHRVERRLATVQEEAIFQRAIADFRNPALWQTHPDRPVQVEKDDGSGWPTLPSLANSSGTSDQTSLLLWRDEHNPALEQIRAARTGLATLISTYVAAPAPANDWRSLHRKLAEYLAAMLAYQRTPLAPATDKDLAGLDAFYAASRAVLVGLKIDLTDTLVKENLADYASKVSDQERELRRLLDEIAEIDLTAMKVTDSPADYQRVKLELQDIDLARKLACIAERRLAIAEDLLELNTDDIPLEPTDAPGRMPRQQAWDKLVRRFNSLNAQGGETSASLRRTTALLNVFDDDTAQPAIRATGQVAAGHLETILGLLRDPSVLIPGSDQPALDYRDEVAKLVPQAAGLTAAVESLKRDAQAHGWTLVRRPHHQLGTTPDQPQPLRDFLPDAIGGPNRSEDDTEQLPPLTAEVLNTLDGRRLAVPFANLLERLGFGIDVAVVDNLNQPLPQRLLLDWIAGQPWAAISHSLGGQHEIVLMSGREPDTDRDRKESQLDEDRSLGYAFVKLMVVPRSLLADILGRQVAVTIKTATKTDANTLDLTIDMPVAGLKALLQAAGWGDNTTIDVDPKAGNSGTVRFKIGDLVDESGSAKVIVTGFANDAPPANTAATVSTATADRMAFRSWLQARSLDASTEASVSPMEDIELRVVQQMASSWWQAIAELPGSQIRLGHLILETRARRWATVPVLGGRAHLDWEAPDAAGRELQIAVRRVSRYEALLRWLRREAVPIVARIDSLHKKGSSLPRLQEVELQRRMVEGVEEPTALPVLVSPHPTRAEFIYSVSTSGARSVVSGLSSRRTGYRGLATQFVEKRAWIEKAGDGSVTDQHDDLIQALSQRDRTHRLTVQSGGTTTTWNVTSNQLEKSGRLVVFSDNRDRVRLAQFTLGASAGEGELKIMGSPFGQPVADGSQLDFMLDPPSDPVFEAGGRLVAQFQRDAAATETVRLTGVDSNTDRIDEDQLDEDSHARNYAGQFAILFVDNQARAARIVQTFDPRTQTLTLNEALPNAVSKGTLQLFHGAPLPKRTRIDRPEAGGPALLRHERLISLPELPYYREYGLGVNPQFEFKSLGTSTHQPDAPVFAQVRPSVLAAHAAHLHIEDTSTEANIYSFRLVLTRQGDQLTPREARAAAELDAGDASLSSSLTGKVLAGDLPDLLCQYQVLWRLPPTDESSSPTEPVGFVDPVYVEFVDLLMPCHPAWSDQGSGTGKPLLRNRNFTSAPEQVLAQVLDTSGNPLTMSNSHPLIQLWQPTPAARPIFVASFRVKVPNPSDSLFGEPGKPGEPVRAILQMQRDGFRSHPLPFSVSRKS